MAGKLVCRGGVLNYDGPYTNPPTNYGPARNRFYRDYAGREFKSFPRTAYNENLVEQLLDGDTSPFLRNKLREGLAMHNDSATMANVASQNTLVDDGVGRVLAALREKGLDKNTLVIFSSDQGNFYGQHGIWQHTIVTTPSSMYETAMNIPLIIRRPDKIEAGRTSDLLTGQYDIPVTILDYAGMGDVRLENSPGKSFRFALTGETGKRKDAVFFEQEETRVIRTEDHAYWKRLNSTGEPALYDVKKDPEQNRNGYDDPAYQEIVADLESYHRDYPAVVFLGLRFPDQVCQGRVTGIGQLDAVFPAQQVQDAAAADCGAVHGQQHRVNLIKVHGIQ